MRGQKIGRTEKEAKIDVACSYHDNKKTAFCATNNEGTQNLWKCKKHKDGTWSCVAARLSGNVSSALKDALNKAQAGEAPMFPVVVGEKTPLYEVVTPNALRLAPGVKFRVVEGPCGKNSGIVLLRPNGATGGYMACGCVGAQTSSCVTVSDNPDHPSCSGGCTDSEGNPHPCDLFGPIIGPPKDPFRIRFLARPTSNLGAGGERK